MELRYADNELERRCTDERYMQRKLGAQMAKALRLRINELRQVSEMGDLLFLAGRWEAMSADRIGQWSGRLTGNWRLIVEPVDEAITVLVVEIVDYHKR
ncbi:MULTISPECIES: type II toxin-antitoxin system RelE/ParE family toxin [Mycobacterium]|uniref:Plasmid maintenance system killer protein n=1 Tax=Mycobacterium syngnathidarum TaxID=1908205 RepID=A0A1Q9WFF0_9MYCO|nr:MULTISPECIES: type II toxin-antitoxin system RelE/ParE family toxin [Mycobacterium]MCG7608759.1 type II toxin-antitoxin system RelE/ParE family toxin [Mycobacterium sp. CnD-18-1]OHU01540.1 plasmid maintenance system killer protein [Mycobacterium syngnathidarum]OLT97527.1 plasmid maintenance system killer protein [Mycobacterium syngnathidarum]